MHRFRVIRIDESAERKLMGITVDYWLISEFECASYKRTPVKAYQRLFGNSADLGSALKEFSEWTQSYRSKLSSVSEEYSRTGLHERLRKVNFNPSLLSDEDQRLFLEQRMKIESVAAQNSFGPVCDFSLEKSWQAIHYLLTGKTEGGDAPIAWAVFGASVLPDHNNYTNGSPLRALSPPQVRAVASELQSLSGEELWSRSSAAEMAAKKIYRISSNEVAQREYVLRRYEGLRNFYADAAAQGEAVLIGIT